MYPIPNCPECNSEYVYFNGIHLYICPECGFEFTASEHAAAEEAQLVRDANGNLIEDGATLTITQEIKLNGTQIIKRGTKAKNIRVLEEPVNGHELECTIDGVGRIYIYAKYVK